jgi:hypothetical protein
MYQLSANVMNFGGGGRLAAAAAAPVPAAAAPAAVTTINIVRTKPTGFICQLHRLESGPRSTHRSVSSAVGGCIETALKMIVLRPWLYCLFTIYTNQDRSTSSSK